MAKGKQVILALDLPDDAVSDTSDRFGDFEVVRDYYHVHPIYKSIKVGKSKSCYDPDSFLSRFPRRQRSKQRFQTEKKTAVLDAENHEGSTVEENMSQCHIVTYPPKPLNVRGKKKADTVDSEVIIERPLCYGRRRSRRLQRSTTDGPKLGKLDSKMFEVYMTNIWRRFTEEKGNAFGYLDSLWFSLYTEGPLREKVLSWIKKKDIFSKKYVFVPIVQWRHWFLLIFCNFGEDPLSKTKGRCMLLLDSLRKANSEQLEPVIRRFVFDIFKTAERPEKEELIRKIPLLIPKVPQQKNGEECGFFVLYYINLFLQSASDSFSFPIGYPHFMKEDWFTPEDVEYFVETLDAKDKTSECPTVIPDILQIG